MAHFLILAVAFFGFFTIVNAVPPDPNDPNFVAFIARLYNRFRIYAQQQFRNQFAFMVMVTQQQLRLWNLLLYPADPSGEPLVDWNQPLSPPDPEQYDNFIVAVPTGEGPEAVHSEQQILPHTQELLDRFREREEGELGAIILYTYLAPCDRCIDVILQHLGAGFANVDIVVLYSYWQDQRDVDRAEEEFPNHGIYFHRIRARCLHDDSSVELQELVNDEQCSCVSLQEFLICSLGQEITGYTQGDPHAVLVDFINRIMAKCSSSLHDLAECSRGAVLQLLENAYSIDRDSLADSVQAYITKAMEYKEENLHFISQPLDPQNPQEEKEPIIIPEDLDNFVQASYNCIDERQGGVLCSSWKAEYKTAGNTICREGSPCDYRDYGYKWCYTDWSDNWEYCCSNTCGYQGYDYRWCYSGTQWEYCGDYGFGQGLRNVKNQPCLSVHPCGKHAHYNYNFWCYTDTDNNWDYCCAPGESCTNNNCYTADQSSSSKYCTQ